MHYLRADEGMSGVLKQRFSDFQVAEIDPQGALVVLTDTQLPAPVAAEGDAAEDTAGELAELGTLIGEAHLPALHALNAADRDADPVDVSAGTDKAARKRIHQLVRSCFDHLESKTLPALEEGAFWNLNRLL